MAGALRGTGAALRALQFYESAFDTARDASDGKQNDGSYLNVGRIDKSRIK